MPSIGQWLYPTFPPHISFSKFDLINLSAFKTSPIGYLIYSTNHQILNWTPDLSGQNCTSSNIYHLIWHYLHFLWLNSSLLNSPPLQFSLNLSSNAIFPIRLILITQLKIALYFLSSIPKCFLFYCTLSLSYSTKWCTK